MNSTAFRRAAGKKARPSRGFSFGTSPLIALSRDSSCLAPINVRKLLPNMIEDFGLYISSGEATLDRNATPDFWSLARSARQQVMQAFDLNALQPKAVAMALIVADRPNPETTYKQIWRSFGYDAVLTNHGKFPSMPELKRFHITAAYPILTPELEPVVAIASVNQRRVYHHQFAG